MLAPEEIASEAAVCRRSWKVKSPRMPAALRAAANVRVRKLVRETEPPRVAWNRRSSGPRFLARAWTLDASTSGIRTTRDS